MKAQSIKRIPTRLPVANLRSFLTSDCHPSLWLGMDNLDSDEDAPSPTEFQANGYEEAALKLVHDIHANNEIESTTGSEFIWVAVKGDCVAKCFKVNFSMVYRPNKVKSFMLGHGEI